MSEAVVRSARRRPVCRSLRRKTSGVGWSEHSFLWRPSTEPASTPGEEPRLFVSGTSEHWGPASTTQTTVGLPGPRLKAPPYASRKSSAAVSSGSANPAGGPGDPDVIYAGTQPSALFRSTDRANRSASSGRVGHPHREEWGEGYGGQAIHSILADPTDPAHVSVAMSTGGVYRTYDRGETWNPANAGIQVVFAPDHFPEFGQCVHKIAGHPDAPNRIFAQNHGGVYRSDNGGGQWTSIADGLPNDSAFDSGASPSRNRIRVPTGRWR